MKELISFEPATGVELWRAPLGDAVAEMAQARTAQAEWAGRAPAERAAILQAFAERVESDAAPFAELIARETGKPLWEAKTEVASVVAKVAISIRAQAERAGDRAIDAATRVRHKPHGVLAVLGPYNFPAHLPNGHIVPALLAGNAVVFKPSEKTPATGARLVTLLHEAGVPEGVVRLLIGDRRQGEALAGADIDGLLFTGSARGGHALARTFAGTPSRILALEMGGNNPLVVWDAPDLDAAAVIAVQSAFLSAGQRCTCARRLIVADHQAAQLLERIEALMTRLIVGAPLDEPAPFMGPLIDNDAASSVMAAQAGLLAAGGVAIRPMTRPDATRPFVTPGLLDVTEVAELPDEEVFGPLLQVMRVPDFAAAIRAANATRYGLSASLVGGDEALFDRFWGEARAGVVNWNRPTNGAPSAAPFGGIGWSGNHRPSAWYAADYCAYPVTSVATDTAQSTIAQGLRAA
jgi:succinylglutamic semialdehyde dehydrogenase